MLFAVKDILTLLVIFLFDQNWIKKECAFIATWTEGLDSRPFDS